MKRDIERKSGIRKIKKPWENNQMSGGRDGQKFSETLDKAEGDGLEECHK